MLPSAPQRPCHVLRHGCEQGVSNDVRHMELVLEESRIETSGKKTEEAGWCPGRVVSGKLILPRTSSCLGPTSLSSLGGRISPSLCLAPTLWDTLRFSSVGASWSSLISLLQFLHLSVEAGLSVDCQPAHQRCLGTS